MDQQTFHILYSALPVHQTRGIAEATTANFGGIQTLAEVLLGSTRDRVILSQTI
jgi:hypothetical protein